MGCLHARKPQQVHTRGHCLCALRAGQWAPQLQLVHKSGSKACSCSSPSPRLAADLMAEVQLLQQAGCGAFQRQNASSFYADRSSC